MHRGGLFLGSVLVLLVRCEDPARLALPADFPLHATDHLFLDLHWCLEQSDGDGGAVGLMEAARLDGIAGVLLELRGLGAQGHVVSCGPGRSYGRRLLRWETRPFLVRLGLTGQEARFELRIWSDEWEGTRDRGARNGTEGVNIRARKP